MTKTFYVLVQRQMDPSRMVTVRVCDSHQEALAARDARCQALAAEANAQRQSRFELGLSCDPVSHPTSYCHLFTVHEVSEKTADWMKRPSRVSER